MTYQFIDTQELDGVLVITMDDPPTRNAIGDEMAGEINQEFDRLEASSDLRAVVLTGTRSVVLLRGEREADGRRQSRPRGRAAVASGQDSVGSA